jgi:hypothetical protein
MFKKSGTIDLEFRGIGWAHEVVGWIPGQVTGHTDHSIKLFGYTKLGICFKN